jgi:hypothetical protein
MTRKVDEASPASSTFRMSGRPVIALVVVGLLSLVWFGGVAASVADTSAPADGLGIDRLIVHAVETPSAGSALQIDPLAELIDPQLPGPTHDVGLIRLPEPVSATEAQAMADELVRSGFAAAAEPDHRRGIAASPNDPLATDQWSLIASTTDFGIGADRAWDVTTGSPSIVVAIVDSGILPHPDISPRLTRGRDFVSETWMSNDGDGWDDDPTDAGNACDGKPSTWHGIHVAGVSGAATNNGLGVAGVDQGSTILPVRVLGSCGGYASDVAAAVRWAGGLPVPSVPGNPTPARVINLSLGGVGHCSLVEQEAIDAVARAGVVVVAAAGNNGRDLAEEPYAPAVCDNVIAVTATTRDGSRAPYSNHGSLVDISAPGGLELNSESEKILSLSNAGTTTPDLSDAGWTYSYKQGTSMAAAHVSGVVSLMLAANDRLSPAQVEEILQDTARPFPSSPRGPEFTCSSEPAALYHCGAGLLDAGAAVRAASEFATAPSEPGGVRVTIDARTATVSWSPPATDGGSELAGYTATTSPGERSCTWSSGPLTCVISGLEHGETYTVRVVARNRAGEGPPAVSAPFRLSPAFVPVLGTRWFDTRTGIGPVRAGLVTPDTPLTIPMTGIGPIPATGVGALALNVTATNATQAGFITVHDCDAPTPNVSALNFNAGEAVANTVLIPPNTNGRVCFTTSTPTHLIADLTGWFPDNTGFIPVPGTRWFDTRTGIGPVRAGLVTPDTPLTIPMTGIGPIPATGVGALALNVTATNATQAGFITVHDCDAPTPNVSALNFNAGEAVANTVLIPPNTNGRVCFTTSTPTHLIADLTGWFPDNTGFIPVPGTRWFDTRTGIGPVRAGLVTPDTPLTIPMTGIGPIPATGVGALALNVTATNATQAGFITVHDCDAPTPNVSALNFNAGEAVANTVLIPPNTNGRVCFTTSTPTHLIADLTGWFPD